MREGKIARQEHEQNFYELALKVSGAVQAARWTRIANGHGYIFSFNGPHSLFIDTIRSLRSLEVAHQLGHLLIGEHDQKISLLERLLEHAATTARCNIYYGAGRDAYDLRGRTAHESIFNVNDGHYRCPNSQQGYSPFSTWTRGLAWAVLGFAELLEFLAAAVVKKEVDAWTARQPSPTLGTIDGYAEGKVPVTTLLRTAAEATAEFYIENSCADGVPMWDTGAPNLYRLGDYLSKPADPHNQWEPVDSSAAAIAAQGLIRLGNYVSSRGDKRRGGQYRQAGLTVANTLLDEPYLSTSPTHQGLLLHSVYHRPNAWDSLAHGEKVPNGESSMWGDYHLRELALLVLLEAQGSSYPVFFATQLSGRRKVRGPVKLSAG